MEYFLGAVWAFIITIIFGVVIAISYEQGKEAVCDQLMQTVL